jgi:hypothetical protein
MTRRDYTLPLLDYPLWWVVCSSDYVLYTGNTSYVTSFYSNLVAVLDKYYPSITNPDTALIERGRRGTGGYGDYAFLPRSGPVTYYSALYVPALNRAADLADLESHFDHGVRWRTRAKLVSQSLAARNFDFSVGAFFDGTCGAEFCKTHAQDGNSLAILAGTVNRTSAVSILSHFSSVAARPYGNAFYDSDAIGEGFSNRVYAFISYFEVAARFKTGLADSALEEIRRLYGWMASHDPGVTVWEGIGDNGTPYEGPYTSMAHGWAAGIVPLMSNYVLGVTPSTPGFKTWRVQPLTSGLSWARGRVPTPTFASGVQGIEVDWEKLDATRFRLNLAVPPETAGCLSIPVADANSPVYVNGVLVYNGKDVMELGAKYEGDYVSLILSAENSDGHFAITVGYENDY